MTKNTLYRNKCKWEKEEVKMLRALYSNNPTKYVASEMERTVKAIKRKAAKLGLRKTKKYLREVLGRKI